MVVDMIWPNFIITYILSASLFVSSNCQSQSFVGRYELRFKGTSEKSVLFLNKDGSYQWHTFGSGEYRSAGNWKIKKNGLALEDSYLKGFGIDVVEKQDSSAVEITLDNIKYRDGEEEIGAYIFADKDTIGCLVAARSCNYKIGSLKTFYIKIGDQLTSRLYHVKSSKTTFFAIIINDAFSLNNYRIFKGARVSILKNGQISFYEKGIFGSFSKGVVLVKAR